MNKNLLRIRYLIFDIVAALIVWVLFMIFRVVVNDGRAFQGLDIFIPVYNFYSNLFLFPVLCVTIHYLSGYYENPVKESKSLEFFTTVIASAIISFIIFFINTISPPLHQSSLFFPPKFKALIAVFSFVKF